MPTNPYLRTKILTASPAELRQMLLDGAIKNAEQGRQGLADRNYETAYNGISRCQSILIELINGLRPEHDRELCTRLSSLYTYMFTRLMDASSRRDPEVVDEVLKLLRYERETWQMLMERLAVENGLAAEMGQTPDAAPLIPPAEPSALVGGRVSVQG